MFKKMLYKEKAVFLAGFIFVLNPCFLSANQTRLASGDRISWDGQYYDFRDSAGIRMIKVWIPPGVKPVRGLFISGHGGGGGDSRNFARDENLRAFAMRLGFAVAGLHNFPGRAVYDEGAAVFFQALNAFAGMGHHPELAHLPFVMYGSSNGGAATYGFVNYAPERAICFVSNVGAGFNPEIPVEEALKVPGIFIVGQFDALIGQRGIDRTKEMMAGARKKGALWAWAIELKGHEDGFSFDVYMKLVEQSVRLRYPKDGDPLKGLLKLREIREEDGWLADMESWDSGLTSISSYADYKGDRSAAGWVLNEDMAFVYRSMATHFNPVRLSVREFDRTINLNTDPGTMFSLGGPVVNPADRITVVLDAARFPQWKKISLFDGALKLGEVEAGREPSIIFATSPSAEVYCLTALATDEKGMQRTSDPMHFFVKDPAMSWKAELPKTAFQGAKTNAGSKNAGREIINTPTDPEDSILVAYGLNGSLENQFAADDNRLSPFWELIGDSKDCIALTQRKNGAAGSEYNPVLTHDCNMTIKAAYGADGIYLLMEINDDNDVGWPNPYAGTEKEQFYLHFDAVDLLIDSRSVKDISDPQKKDSLISRNFGLTTTTRQYQVACGIPGNRPSGFKRALADPWDFNDTYYTLAEAKTKFGMQVENIKTAPFHKAQEWFLPWSEVGGGLPGEPDPGTRLAFTAGFNDRDEGEHFPPGVTSSGGTVNASNALRWIKKSDPWGSGKPPFNWGEIELGNMINTK